MTWFKKNKTIVWSLLAIVTSAVGLWFVFQRPSFTPQTDSFTFERVVDQDEGRQLVATDLVSNEGIRLTEVFNPSTGTFAPEQTSRYGADRSNPKGGGVGLEINFVVKDGGKIEKKKFLLPSWTSFERPTTRPQRRTEVTDAGIRLAEAISQFVAPVLIRRTFGIALDITEGIQPALVKRVRQILTENGAIRLGADKKNSVILNLYNITQSPYQGGREKPNLGSPEEVKVALVWLLKERPAEAHSSVFRGLVPILEEMLGGKDTSPRLDIFTDGLENTDEVSVYKKPELLEKSNWATMDEVAHLESLKLSGLTVHIHPLPAKSARHAEMMEKGIAYLANRLTKAGAAVKVEPF